jgi:hypothetical protein
MYSCSNWVYGLRQAIENREIKGKENLENALTSKAFRVQKEHSPCSEAGERQSVIIAGHVKAGKFRGLGLYPFAGRLEA